MANQQKKAKTYEPGTLAFLVFLGIFLCALGVLVLLAVLGFQGTIFDFIRNGVYGLFGCLGLGAGALLIWAGLICALSSGRKMPKRAFFFSCLFYLCLLSLFNLFSKVGVNSLLDEAVRRNAAIPLDNPSGFLNMIYSVFMLSYHQHAFGGCIGMLLSWPLWKFLGDTPAIVILILLGLLSVLFITRFDFVQLGENLLSMRDERKERRQQEKLQQEQERLYLEQQQQALRDQSDLQRPAYLRRKEAVQQPMPVQPYPGYYAAPYQQQPQPQQMGYTPYPQPYNMPSMPLPDGMTQAPQGELYNEIIFPQNAEPTWRRSKKKEVQDARSRWVGNNYTLGNNPPAVTAQDVPDGGGSAVFLSRGREEAIEKLGQLRRRKQELNEQLESNRLAAEETKRNYQLPVAQPAPIQEETGFAEEMLEPITMPGMGDATPVQAPMVQNVQVAPPAAPTPARDRHEAYRRPVEEPFAAFTSNEPEVELPEFAEAETPVKSAYVFPPIDLLNPPPPAPAETRKLDEENAMRLENTLNSFDIPAKVQRVTHGPSVTRFELGLVSSGINVKKILNIADNIALDMAANGPVRFEVPIKGTNLFGIEIPNQQIQSISLREVLLSEEMKNAKSKLTVALGKDVTGKPILCDLARMPHLLIAGQTGSGKSVCINTIINSLLYRTTPEEVRLILIDPKVVELQCYNVVPHLLIPVVSDPMKAAGALSWALAEMQDRYRKMESKKVRDLAGYNAKLEPGEPKMPRIVIIIDELADLMMASKKAVEETITRLAQLARASGIHMVVATQRPTVDVVTGLIKSNIPSRIAFSVASGIDSRTILDQVGAEKLLGSGDMFYSPTGISAPVRVQGCYLSDGEIEHIVDFIAAHSRVEFDPDVIEALENQDNPTLPKEESDEGDSVDERLHEAIEMVINDGQASISMLQRRMKIGYARAGRLIDDMANRGIITQSAGSKPREVLITMEEYQRIKDVI